MLTRILYLLTTLLVLAAPTFGADPGGGDHGHAPLDVHAAWVIPFVLMLLSIAVLPLVKEHWWEENINKLKIAGFLALPVLVYFGFFLGHEGLVRLEHAGVEYFQFICLLGSLYIISGGIYVSGTLLPTPTSNARILLIGSVLASFIGTTGASMLLIRPLLNANKRRRYKVHTVIFFIFVVSNIGGLLTPLGDPPLFLGYLRGVPFAWTFSLWMEWALLNGVLIALYWIYDSVMVKREEMEALAAPAVREPVKVAGNVNFLFLLGVVLLVAFVPSIATEKHQYVPWRELGMGLLVLLSLGLTPKAFREGNNFNYHAIQEVAYLFIGIFITMVPALVTIEHLAKAGSLPLHEPWQFFWFTGSLSSFLDNAPTYVVFFETAKAMTPATVDAATVGYQALAGGENGFIRTDYLVAISLGAVFMGANTYIGNGPNFMVKAIAEGEGVKMPSFFGYLGYSVVILIPLFGVVTWLWLL